MPDDSDISRRKDEHLRINLQEDVSSGLTSGFERYAFTHQALPELNLRDVNLAVDFLGKRLSAPLLISGMTGGSDRAGEINLRLAEAAEAAGIAMGLGSQRAALEHPELAASFRVRRVAPHILLLANLGAVQLNTGYGVDECRRAVDMVEADALVLHLNPLQEALQPGGNSDFAGLLAKIEAVCARLGAPVVVKEVGWGISPRVARQLMNAGVSAIDVAGAGGTSWSEVERHRLEDPHAQHVAAAFRDWGIPTAESLRMVHGLDPTFPLIASGGLRDGVDLAKAIALGAKLGGMAGPFLKAADVSTEEVAALIREVVDELRIAAFVAGAGDMQALAATPLVRPEA